MLSYKALKVVSNYEMFILVSYRVYNKNVFAIPVHKTCEDSRDIQEVQFVLEAAPQHQTSNDAYFFILQASLDSVPEEFKNDKS